MEPERVDGEVGLMVSGEAPAGKFNPDDKDLAMTGIVVLCIVGGLILWAVGAAAAAVGALFTGGVTALGSLASGRKKEG